MYKIIYFARNWRILPEQDCFLSLATKKMQYIFGIKPGWKNKYCILIFIPPCIYSQKYDIFHALVLDSAYD